MEIIDRVMTNTGDASCQMLNNSEYLIPRLKVSFSYEIYGLPIFIYLFIAGS